MLSLFHRQGEEGSIEEGGTADDIDQTTDAESTEQQINKPTTQTITTSPSTPIFTPPSSRLELTPDPELGTILVSTNNSIRQPRKAKIAAISKMTGMS